MPPFSDSDLVLYMVAAAVFAAPAIYWVKVARRRTELIRFKLRRVGVTGFVYAGGVVFLHERGNNDLEAIALSACLAVLGAKILVDPPSSNRRIPAKIRRAVIARDLKGERFDASIHEIDHIVPFSAGGDNSERNLRVIRKTDNRRKGSRMPKLDEMW